MRSRQSKDYFAEPVPNTGRGAVPNLVRPISPRRRECLLTDGLPVTGRNLSEEAGARAWLMLWAPRAAKKVNPRTPFDLTDLLSPWPTSGR
jgi:hypothetical protein